MRKISLNIFVLVFAFFIFSQESYALGRKGCSTFDWLCQISGKGKKSSSELTTSKEVQKNKKIARKTKKIRELDTEFNWYAGEFDFSDEKKKSGIIGIQHQDEDLFRKSRIGRISPITGFYWTEHNAMFLYTGVQAEYDLGFLTITPSFAPGYYSYGDGKDLGYPLEFKSEIQISANVSESSQFGFSYNHLSNASLGSKNPGANSYFFNFLKQF